MNFSTDFNFLRKVLDIVVKNVDGLKFDFNHAWHRHLMLLYTTIIQDIDSVCILIQAERIQGIAMLLRSALEARIDFQNLIKDEKYGYRLKMNEIKEWLKVLKSAADGNPFLAGIGSMPDLPTQISEREIELKKLKNSGYFALRISEKFELTQDSNFYKSVYNFLCSESHNDMRALVSRNIRVDGKSKFEMHLFPAVDFSRIDPYIDTFSEIVISSSCEICDVLKCGDLDSMNRLKEEHKEIRSKSQSPN